MIAAAPENFITYVQRLMTVGRPSPRRSRASGSTSGSPRPRSRSPHRRHRFFVASRDHNHELFDIDDFMTTFLSNRPPPVSQQRLLEIPILAITQDQTNVQCSICFDEFLLEEESVRKLPCNHPFHVSIKTSDYHPFKTINLPTNLKHFRRNASFHGFASTGRAQCAVPESISEDRTKKRPPEEKQIDETALKVRTVRWVRLCVRLSFHVDEKLFVF